MDLEEEVLSEPEFTQVFIDEQTGSAYKTMTSRKKGPMFEDYTLEVAPGVKVIWDGKPWTITNLGEKNISLLAEEGIVNVPKDQFFNLVCEHQIKGVDNEIIKAINSVINSKLAEASEQELKEATRLEMGHNSSMHYSSFILLYWVLLSITCIFFLPSVKFSKYY